MTTARANSLKWLGLCSSIGIPLISIFVWLIINGTRLVDSVDNLGRNQISQGMDIKEIHGELNGIRGLIDSLTEHQRINEINNNYRFENMRYRNHATTFITEHKDASGRVVMIPAGR